MTAAAPNLTRSPGGARAAAGVPAKRQSMPPSPVLGARHCRHDSQVTSAGVPAKLQADTNGQPPGARPVIADTLGPNAGVRLAFADLRIAAEVFRDAQDQRIATENRLRAGNVDLAPYAAVLDLHDAIERASRLVLARAYRRMVHPDVRAWQVETRGVGEHLIALLLGYVGHPRWAFPHVWEGEGQTRQLIALEPFPRNVAKLWAYCGHGDPSRVKRRGMTAADGAALGHPQAKRTVFLLAEACMKSGGNPYRDTYDAAREVYGERLHSAPCHRCGPSGRPAAEGSPWSKAHQHGAALRKAGKVLLRDLWQVAEGWPVEEMA